MNLLYFSTEAVENFSKRRPLFFIAKAGFTVTKLVSPASLSTKIKELKPICIIVGEEEDLQAILDQKQTLPVLFLLKKRLNLYELSDKYIESETPVFVRYEDTPLPTLLETISLISSTDQMEVFS